MFIILWIVFAFCVAAVFGAARTIGFWPSLLFCIVLSPLIGLFVTLFFKTTEEDNRQKQMLNAVKKQNSVADEIGKLAELRQSNKITDAEFEQLKAKLF
jgi:hypothetical protein